MPTPLSEVPMLRAIELSQLGYPAPNPRVGCVIVKDGEVVGEGHHDHAGGAHAEVVALTVAGERARGATAYVTLEPCNHFGRTGPCSVALVEAGVERVVFAVADPNPKAAGGADRLRSAGIDVVSGMLSSEAEAANQGWLTAVRRQRPYVVGKSAISLDGRTALTGGASQWITGPEARRQGHILRAECGAVLVGRGTAEKDDPSLTVREVEVANQPLRILFDRYRTLPQSRKLFSNGGNWLRVVASTPGPNELEVRVESGGFVIGDFLEKAFRLGITSLLVEGGARTLSAFLAEGVIDRLELFIAPKVLGSGMPWATLPEIQQLGEAQRWCYDEVRQLGSDLWITASPDLGGTE